MIRNTVRTAPLNTPLFRKDRDKMVPMGHLLHWEVASYGYRVTFNLDGRVYTFATGNASAFWHEEEASSSSAPEAGLVSNWLQDKAQDLGQQLAVYHAGSDEEDALAKTIETILALSREAQSEPWAQYA